MARMAQGAAALAPSGHPRRQGLRGADGGRLVLRDCVPQRPGASGRARPGIYARDLGRVLSLVPAPDLSGQARGRGQGAARAARLRHRKPSVGLAALDAVCGRLAGGERAGLASQRQGLPLRHGGDGVYSAGHRRRSFKGRRRLAGGFRFAGSGGGGGVCAPAALGAVDTRPRDRKSRGSDG